MISVVTVTFAAIFFSVMAVYYAVTAVQESPEAELKRRLQRLEAPETEQRAGHAAVEIVREVTPLEQFLFRLPVLARLQRMILHSGVEMQPVNVLLLILSCPLAGFTLMFLIKHNLAVAAVAALISLGLPLVYLRHLRKQREQKFTEQLPEVLTMVARSLRAGHSLTGAIELVGLELKDPAGKLFRIVYEQQRLGVRIGEALAELMDKIDSVDLRFFVTIVNINHEVGGNLSEVLDKLSETIRSRLQVKRQVRVFTAQGRMSGYILALLPVTVFIIIYLMVPGYLEPFFRNHKAQYILAGAGMFEIIGFFVIRKIIDIRI